MQFQWKGLWRGRVDANLKAGQPTGMSVQQGETITITATGTAERGPGKAFGPDGDTEYKPDGLLCPEAPVGALVMKIGDQYYPVTSKLSAWIVPVAGEITLFFNDVPDGFDNNTGAFDVDIVKDSL